MNLNWKKFLVIFFTCLLFLILIIIFSENYLILGGEGNYITDFHLIRRIDSSTWVASIKGTGFPNSVLNNLTTIFDFFSFLQQIGTPLKIINLISFYLVYLLPFLSMFWMLHRILKNTFITSYLISLFYILNPFSTYHLQGLMFWNTAPLFVLPLMFGIIYKYYLQKFKLFLFFGLLTAILAFSLSNIPYLGIFHIFLVISIIIIPYMRNLKHLKPKLKIVLSNFFIVELSFVLFNAWWLINFIRFVIEDLANYYTSEFAIGVAKISSGAGGIVFKIFNLTTLITLEKGSFFSDLYNKFPVNTILYIPFLLIIWNLFISTKKNQDNKDKTNVVIFAFILIIFFLNKGVSEPFKGIYLWLLENIPFFIIFKSPLEKFSVLLVFLITFALVQVFSYAKSKWSYYLFILYLIVCSIPYLTLKFMPEIQFEKGKYISRKYIEKKGYFDARQALNLKKLDYRVISLPGSNNYQVTLLNHGGNKYYRGVDPFVFSVNKPFISAYTDPTTNLDSIFTNFSNTSIEEGLFNIYNVKSITINKDIYPAFGFREKESVKKLINIFSKENGRENFDPIAIFSRKIFLPHFYVPDKSIISNKSEKTIALFSLDSTQIRSALFFENQNQGKKLNKLIEKKSAGGQILEFKKISPTKYRVVIHRAKGKFPLVFSESFHPGWKLYKSVNPPVKNSITNLNNYKILDGNDGDQATKEEINEFISQGFISTLGDGKQKKIVHKKWKNGTEILDYIEKYRIDFVSKNFQDTIQNDNLAQGYIHETWFKKYLDEKNHLVANAYANGWALDTDVICSNSTSCIQNADGSYELELIIEFWPERLYYLGLIISVLTGISSMGYFIFFYFKEKKQEYQNIR